MSRAKFEEWYEAHAMPAESDWFKRDADGYYVLPFVAHAWDGWLAGRESMRDEAAAVASDEWVKDHLIPASDAIKRIEP